MKRLKISSVIILLAFTLSGCFLNKEEDKNNNDWQNEILMAQECGMDGLPCCLDKDPSCFYGQQCCVDPNNPTHTACRDECTCGHSEEFCCENNQCEDGLVCRDGYCVECGNKEEPCCLNDECQEGLVCYQNECVECGLPGNPCCSEGKACLGEGKLDDTRTECEEDICVLCGFSGQKACVGEPFCNPHNLLNNGICYHCGGYNQPCCENQFCDKGLQCKLGFCN